MGGMVPVHTMGGMGRWNGSVFKMASRAAQDRVRSVTLNGSKSRK